METCFAKTKLIDIVTDFKNQKMTMIYLATDVKGNKYTVVVKDINTSSILLESVMKEGYFPSGIIPSSTTARFNVDGKYTVTQVLEV